MILHIKNMVCDRCSLIVRQQLTQLGFSVSELSLGRANVTPDPSPAQLQDISAAFQVLGFELIDKEKDKLVEQIKNAVINLVHYSDLEEINRSLMHVIADQLNRDYTYLSRLFSDREGITIERYIIQQKIERVKELLEYGELNLNEIAYKMGYSSSAHLSAQFKSIAGMSPSKYKSSDHPSRRPLDKVSK
ncbi:helix-turn-helix domain-containing protein [Pedobacter deserti]|uniref:helix-turn-helix domain-containing protein n=1 Tax=Pedobacter deserti TaxID=2817382 RepID=UPI00210C91F3|nr:helix-turn-helix domain-containing protein [Pedobacter sp. SYSU D00382]